MTLNSLLRVLLLSSSEHAGWPGARVHLQPPAGLESPVLTPEQHLCQASGTAPPKLGEPGPKKGTALLPSTFSHPSLPFTPQPSTQAQQCLAQGSILLSDPTASLKENHANEEGNKRPAKSVLQGREDCLLRYLHMIVLRCLQCSLYGNSLVI